jgi:hypothetical protein
MLFSYGSKEVGVFRNKEVDMFKLSASVLKPFFLAALFVCGAANADSSERQQEILRFKTMYPVDGPFLNSTAIRHVPGDESPWIIKKFANGILYSNGRLIIHVRGLVFPDRPNDEDNFRGLVSCLTEDGNNIVESNVITQPFPTGPEGNADIDAVVALPNPCVAPIVMILAGSEDKWFAVTGFESE